MTVALRVLLAALGIVVVIAGVAAVYALRRRRAPGTVRAMLSDPDPRVRRAGVECVGVVGVAPYAAALVRLADAETDPGVEQALAEVLVANRERREPASDPGFAALALWAERYEQRRDAEATLAVEPLEQIEVRPIEPVEQIADHPIELVATEEEPARASVAETPTATDAPAVKLFGRVGDRTRAAGDSSFVPGRSRAASSEPSAERAPPDQEGPAVKRYGHVGRGL